VDISKTTAQRTRDVCGRHDREKAWALHVGLALQETAKSTRAKTLVDKDQALIDSLSTRVLTLVDKTS
jgi:hypothetical protein